MRHALRAARDLGWESVNIVAHNFELMNRAKTRIDPIVHRGPTLRQGLELMAVQPGREGPTQLPIAEAARADVLDAGQPADGQRAQP